MVKVLVSESYVHGQSKPKRRYAIKGGIVPPFTMELNGERYIMPGWYKLADDEPTPDIKDIVFLGYPYKAPKPAVPGVKENKAYKVKSSKGDKEYQVSVSKNGAFSCTCAGYGFRRKCRHIDYIKNELLARA